MPTTIMTITMTATSNAVEKGNGVSGGGVLNEKFTISE
jgi:hypothetical protein